MDQLLGFWNMAWDFICGHLMIWNLLFAVVIVFFERRNPKSVWAWLMLLFFLPGVGLIIYLFLGQDMRKRRIFRTKELDDQIGETVRYQEKLLLNGQLDPKLGEYADLAMYNLKTSGAMITEENDVDIFTDGNRKFEALLEDLQKAERFIHMQYYIIKDDILFHRICEVLGQKAAQGVEVRLLYDAMGSRFVKRSLWKKLNGQGIRTAEFFPALLRRFHLRINYRNHRKIVVIDNKVAYVGGFNVGKEYIDLDEKIGHWRDTHLRIRGRAVLGLQMRFLLDWNYAARENLLLRQELLGGLEPGVRDRCKMQVISSGPDNSVCLVRDNYLRMIGKARESIYIQTPYFIPDESILNALLIAVNSGISVNLMVPCKPDHPFVYWATYSYVGDLVMAGANCYTYNNGFLHSKGMVVDSKVFCCGTANMDIRSFALNFEVNVIVYDEAKACEMERTFKEDLQFSTRITRDEYAKRKLSLRIREQACRLMSPLL